MGWSVIERDSVFVLVMGWSVIERDSVFVLVHVLFIIVCVHEKEKEKKLSLPLYELILKLVEIRLQNY